MKTKTKLQQWRERRFLSIRKLAEISGLMPSTIVDIEKGKRRPREETAMKLAQALGITLDDLADLINNFDSVA